MTERVVNGLGLPAGIYRINVGGDPTVFVPNGITADSVESVVYANVIPVSGGYDCVLYDDSSGKFVPAGNPNPSSTHFNSEVAALFNDILRQIFLGSHHEEEYPYAIVTSESRANIVDDLATMKTDFFLNP